MRVTQKLPGKGDGETDFAAGQEEPAPSQVHQSGDHHQGDVQQMQEQAMVEQSGNTSHTPVTIIQQNIVSEHSDAVVYQSAEMTGEDRLDIAQSHPKAVLVGIGTVEEGDDLEGLGKEREVYAVVERVDDVREDSAGEEEGTEDSLEEVGEEGGNINQEELGQAEEDPEADTELTEVRIIS